VRFTVEETAALPGGVAGPGLPGAAAEALAERTEGWVADLQLAGCHCAGAPTRPSLWRRFPAVTATLLDYLTEEVLNRQPDQVRGFLLETSVLERLSGRLCDAVTGRTDSQRLLELVERANLFLAAAG
jgi:LuxR family maltose regulon positive regulatory protein